MPIWSVCVCVHHNIFKTNANAALGFDVEAFDDKTKTKKGGIVFNVAVMFVTVQSSIKTHFRFTVQSLK